MLFIGNDVNVNGSKGTPTTATAAPNRDASPADSSGSNGTIFFEISTLFQIFQIFFSNFYKFPFRYYSTFCYDSTFLEIYFQKI